MSYTAGNALATVRFEIHDAIAFTCTDTGLRPGPGTEALIDAIVAKLKDPACQWAFRAVVGMAP